MGAKALDLKSLIRRIPDYPRPGIVFRDITPLLTDARGFNQAIDALVKPYAGQSIDKVAGLEARGFILGGAVAHQLSAGFVAIRKQGKLPWKTIRQPYQLEYGFDCMEIHQDMIEPGEKVLLIDDLIATGGTALAGIKLLENAGANIVGCSFIIDLPALGGAKKLEEIGLNVISMMQFDGL